MNFYITVTRLNLDGFAEDAGAIGYDGESTDNYDNFMFFDSTKEAEEYIEKHKAEWAGNCSFAICNVE